MDREEKIRTVARIVGEACEMLEKGNVTVYKCGKIIRIDIKAVFE